MQIKYSVFILLSALLFSGCITGRHHKIRFVSHKSAAKKESSKEVHPSANKADEIALGTNAGTIEEVNTPVDPVGSTFSASEEPLDTPEHTNKQSLKTTHRNSSASEIVPVRNENEVKKSQKSRAKQMSPLVFALLMIALILLAALCIVATFLAFSLGYSNGVTLLIVSIGLVALIFLTVKTFRNQQSATKADTEESY